MTKRQDIFFVKVTQIPAPKFGGSRYKFVNCKEIKSIQEINKVPSEDGSKLFDVYIVTLYDDPFEYQISKTDYERLIKL